MRLTVGGPTGTRVPPIGLGRDRDLHRSRRPEAALLAALSPGAFARRGAARPRGLARGARGRAGRRAAAIGAHLEVSLHLREEHVDELADVAAALADGPTIDRVLVVNADSRTATAAETTRGARAARPRRAVSVGAPAPRSSAARRSTSPSQPHAARRRDVGRAMLLDYAADPRVHRPRHRREPRRAGARRCERTGLAGGEAVVVSPITLRRRVNFHAAGDPPPGAGRAPRLGRRPSVVAPRRRVDGRKRQVRCRGGRRLGDVLRDDRLARGASSAQPARAARGVPLGPGGSSRSTTHSPTRRVARRRGARAASRATCSRHSGLPSGRPKGARACSSPTSTPHEQEVVVAPLSGRLALRRLNESTAAGAAADPAAFRRRSESRGGGGSARAHAHPVRGRPRRPGLARRQSGTTSPRPATAHGCDAGPSRPARPPQPVARGHRDRAPPRVARRRVPRPGSSRTGATAPGRARTRRRRCRERRRWSSRPCLRRRRGAPRRE